MKSYARARADFYDDPPDPTDEHLAAAFAKVTGDTDAMIERIANSDNAAMYVKHLLDTCPAFRADIENWYADKILETAQQIGIDEFEGSWQDAREAAAESAAESAEARYAMFCGSQRQQVPVSVETHNALSAPAPPSLRLREGSHGLQTTWRK